MGSVLILISGTDLSIDVLLEMVLKYSMSESFNALRTIRSDNFALPKDLFITN